VIAIENVRLFDEVWRVRVTSRSRCNNRPQTADVLKVISGSPARTEPVFDKILQARGSFVTPNSATSCASTRNLAGRSASQCSEAHASSGMPSVVAGPETNLGRVQAFR